MRILIFLPSEGYGGAERIAIASAKRYALFGNEVVLVTDRLLTDPQVQSDLQDSAVKMVGADIISKRFGSNTRMNNLWISFSALAVIFKIRPDITILHLPYFNVGHQIAFAALKAGRKLVLIFHSAPKVFKPNRIYSVLARKYINKRLFLVAVSEDNRRNLAKSFGLDVESVIRIYNGIPWNYDMPLSGKRERNILRDCQIEDHHIVFITVARLDVDKGFFEIIYAASKLVSRFPQARFLWVGGGPGKQDLLTAVEKYDLSKYIIFSDFTDRVDEFLDAADFFLFPTHFEGLSLSLLEAVSRKLPVIASDANSNGEVIMHKRTGLLFRTFDSCDLLEKMEWAVQHQSEMAEMASRAFVQSKQIFTIDQMVDLQLAAFNKIVVDNPPKNGL